MATVKDTMYFIKIKYENLGLAGNERKIDNLMIRIDKPKEKD